MGISERTPDQVIERALVRIRRSQQSRGLQRRSAQDNPVMASAVTAARFRYLDTLEESDEGMPISWIASEIGVDRPRASRLTKELLDEGLVERDTHPGDSRYTRIRLTANGRELVDRVHEARIQSVAEALAGFTNEDARTLATLLQRFVDAWSTEHPNTQKHSSPGA